MRKEMKEEFKGWCHLMISGFYCNKKRLNDMTLIYRFLETLPEKIGMKCLGTPVVYRIDKTDHEDPGITGTQIIFTSHIAVHTFPEGQKNGKRKPRGIERKIYSPFFVADIFSCKDFDINIATNELIKLFKPKLIEKQVLFRLREDAECIDVETEVKK